jgi:hypothetical protein
VRFRFIVVAEEDGLVLLKTPNFVLTTQLHSQSSAVNAGRVIALEIV